MRTPAPRPSSRRRLAVGLVVIGLVISCSPATTTPSPSGSADPSGSAGPVGTDGSPAPSLPDFVTPDPNAAFDPVALASAVYDADTDAARQQAIVDALAGIGLGIYKAEGAAIVAGAERTATDFMVYDFEIAALSGGIADGDEVYLEDLAQELSTMNVSAGGAAFTSADFATAVTAATAEAMARPDEHLGYALRLARELSMRRVVPVDLAAAPGAQPIVLDPLAAFLVASDFSLPKVLAADPPAETATGPTTGIVLAAVTAANPCTGFTSQVGAWHAGMTQVAGAASANASFSRSLQARLVGGTVKFAMTNPGAWHRPHKGRPSQPKAYHVQLQVRVPVPPNVNCGPIRNVGGQIQGGGQIVGAQVTWDYPGLEDHAKVDCTHVDCGTTDTQGHAYLSVDPKFELGPGGIGPEFTRAIDVSAEVDLFRALGPELLGALSLPPDMRVLARRQVRTDVSWHRAYEFRVQIESQLYVNKVKAYGYANHMGTATAEGSLPATTVHAPGDLAFDPPSPGLLNTVSNQGTGPACTAGASGAVGSITIEQHSDWIDFQVIDIVVDPMGPDPEISLYLDVGPIDDYQDDTYRLRQCANGKVVYDGTSKGTNLWEATIFYGYTRGLLFSGFNSSPGVTNPGIWNLRAAATDWGRFAPFTVATWDTPQDCGGYCDPAKSWLRMWILAEPLADP